MIGTPIGLDERGALLAKLEDGTIMPIFSAETMPAPDNRS